MMETEESLSHPEIEHDTKKYKKHINDLIEDAEIEAELEAEKKIRSKNSRVFSISMFGLGLLALVYLQINTQSASVAIPDKELTEPANTVIESAEEMLAKQVPIVKDGSSNIPFSKVNASENIVEPAKITLAEKRSLNEKPKIADKLQKKIEKPIQISKPSTNRTKATPSKTNTRFFVQTGAFSQKKNAEASMKKLQAKGFSPLIHVVTRGNKKTYLVQLGVFPNKEKAKITQEKLARAGYPKSIIKH